MQLLQRPRRNGAAPPVGTSGGSFGCRVKCLLLRGANCGFVVSVEHGQILVFAVPESS